ncbi:hypothetical protein JST97_28315 [bacterium]|nr:hypothetical protein [bacterium]
MAGFFREWRFDRALGQIYGFDPLDPARLPAEYWRLVDNSRGQLERIEEHRPELSRPAIKLLSWEDGRIVEALDYNPDGSLRLIHQYIYGADGHMVDRLEFDGEENSRGHVVSVWDQNGLEVAEIAYDPNQRLQSKSTYQYDELGRVCLARYYDAHEKLNGWRQLFYDGNDRVIEKHWYGPDGKLRSRYCQEFTPDGQVSQARLYNGQNELLSERSFAPA